MNRTRLVNSSFSLYVWGTLIVLAFYIGLIVLTVLLSVDSESYGRYLFSSRVLSTVKLSALCATAAAVFALIFAVPTAYLLARQEFPGRAVLDTLFDIPIVFSPVALGTVLLLFFASDAGRLFERHVLVFTYAIPGIILAQFSVVVALAIRSLKAVFEDVNPRYACVARFLGCNRWQAFLKIELPLARNGVIGSFIMVWARAVGEFGATVTLAGAMPRKTETIPSAIYLGLAGADVQETLVYVVLLLGITIAVLLAIRFVLKQ